MDRFDFIVATRFINVSDSPYRKFLNWCRLTGPPDTDLNETVMRNADVVIDKHIYSSASFQFLEYLIKHQIDEVYLVGIDTDCCVLKTAVDLFEQGIKSFVLSYYCASNGGSASHEAALLVLSRMIGKNQILSEDIAGFPPV